MKTTTLTEQQEAPVHWRELGTAIIEATAGSGKTTTVEAIVRQAIAEGVHPKAIMVLTFTQAGGQAIRRRLQDAREIGIGVGDLAWAGTVHSLAMATMGTRAVDILSEDEYEDLIKGALIKADVNWSLAMAREVLQAPGDKVGHASVVDRIVRRALETLGKTTFDHVLRDFAESGKAAKMICDLLIIDEAQDTNPVEAEIYDQIQAGQRFVVGDTNQAIFQFRGARTTFMRRTRRRAAAVFQLTETFRCSQRICRLANALAGTEMTTRAPDLFDDPVVVEHATPADELECAIDWARNRQGGVAILCRFNHQVAAVRRAFAERDIPIQPRISGAAGEEQKTTVRYLRAAITGDLEPIWDDSEHLRRRWGSIEELRTRLVELRNRILVLEALGAPEFAARHPIVVSSPDLQTALERIVQGGIELGSDERGIHVDTIHAAKGREWNAVLLFGADDRLDNQGDVEKAEATNLLYVAITRARFEFRASWARFRLDAWNGNRVNARPCKMLADAFVKQA